MPANDGAAVVRRYFEDVLGGGRLYLLNELVAPVYVDHTAQPGRSPGIAGIREVTHMFRTAFPDLTVTMEDCLADADRVATRFTLRGAHTGPFADMAPTGRRVTIGGMAITRLAGGLIAEQWDQADMLGLLRQLGVFPRPRHRGASCTRAAATTRRSTLAKHRIGRSAPPQNRRSTSLLTLRVGDLAAPISSSSAAGASQACLQIQLKIMKLCIRIRWPA